MPRIVRMVALTCSFLLSLGTFSSAQITISGVPATPPTVAKPAPQTVAAEKSQEMSVLKAREDLLAFLDRMPADRKVEFGGRQLSGREFRSELQKLEQSGKPVRQIDVAEVRREIESKEAVRVVGANRLAAEAVKAFNQKMVAEKKSLEKIFRGVTQMPPHIDAIHNPQPAYSPGMYIIIRGSGFYTYGTSHPQVRINYKGSKATNLTTTLSIVDDPNSWATSNSWLVIAKIPDNLGGFMDQAVQLFVETGPAGNRRKSNEVPVQFIAKRLVKSVEPQHIQTQFCYNVLVACDREDRDVSANWRWCKDFTASEKTIPWDGYSNSRYGAYYEIVGYAIRTLHEARCMYSASAPGMDIYTIPLFNGHEIGSTSVVSGFPPSAAAPVCIGVNNTPAGLIQVWFLVKTTLYYGINVTVVGPAGVPYHAAW